MKPETQTQTTLTEKEVAEIIRKVIEEGKEEAKLILTIELHNRTRGCGYVYLYRTDLEIIEGSVDIVVLEKREYNCDVTENIAVIPKSVPAAVRVTYIDESPEVGNSATYYIFDGKSWKSIEVPLPK